MKEEFKTVILTAGTKFKRVCTYTEQMKNCWDTCDGHAEAVCYQLASVYMIKEMHKLQQNMKSIFQHALEGGYELKRNIKFHLFISKRPCGFMADKTIKCLLSWKNDFTKKPHILECSSKILISSYLGIQGPLSCLLVKPVYISSVVIVEHEKSKTGNLTPDDNDIGKHFKTFHGNLRRGQIHGFTMETPDIIICKENLCELFPSIKTTNTVPLKVPSHFTFQASDDIESLSIDTDQKDTISKYVKNLQSKANLSMICRQLNTYLKAVIKVSLALKINDAIDEALKITLQYLKSLKIDMINIRVSLIKDLHTIKVTGEARKDLELEDLDIQYYNSECTDEEKNEKTTCTGLDNYKNFNNLRERFKEASKKYNDYHAFKKQIKYDSLFKIDCDWAKTMLKLQYIYNLQELKTK